jgi:hypothetical protein
MAQPLALNFRVADPSRLFEGSVGLVFPLRIFNSVDRMDRDGEITSDA